VGITLIFLLPTAILVAISNLSMGEKIVIFHTGRLWNLFCLYSIGLNVLSEFIAGVIIPGNPIGNVTFKVYAYISQSQAIFLLANLKLGHYMKVYYD
jgi:hypothetical protein